MENSESCVFKGKKTFVIGGSGGIGAALSLKLAENGADLFVHGRTEEKLSALKEKILKKTGKQIQTFAFDFEKNSTQKDNSPAGILSVSEFENSDFFAELCTSDILCICYGPFVQKNLCDTNSFDWQKMALLNYALPGFLVSSVLKNMVCKKWGRILLFGGTGTSFRSEYRTNTAYAGAKSALSVLCNSVASEFAEFGITCNMILPGFTQTEYTEKEESKILSQKMPLNSMITSASVAETALFLLKNGDLNGANVRLDRGWSPLK